MQARLIIWGASGHARVIADIIRLSGAYTMAGFLDDISPGRAGESFEGSTILGGRDAIAEGRRVGVTHLMTIDHDCAIGDGAVVVSDIPDAVVAYGVPARAMRSRA